MAAKKNTVVPEVTSSSLSIAEARRIALHAQGFGQPHPRERITPATLVSTVQRLGLVQMDSVNVLVRAHYVPFFSRLGAYDRTALHTAAYDATERKLFEYWGHEASLLPLEAHPLLRWRMERARAGVGTWKRVGRFLKEKAKFVNEVLAQLRDRGPLGAGEIGAGKKGKKGWWEWSDAKTALECLFWAGEVTTANRRHFERIYDVTERVIPAHVLSQSTPSEAEAHRTLVDIAARALGVATESDLRDYFRLTVVDARRAISELIEQGRLQPARIEGWKQLAYWDTQSARPDVIEASALLSPFDSLVWERPRTERLFDFHYRLEIYTPAHKRVHGYYVLPFLFNDRLAARVDLKADRPQGTLRVLAAHLEEGLKPEQVTPHLARELHRMAGWLGLERVTVGRRGRLTSSLRAQLKSASG